LALVVRGGAAGVLALLKRAAGIEVTNSLAKAAERFLRRQVELEDASPSTMPRPLEPSMPHA